MQATILFPHFYMTNENYIRHQLLCSDALYRLQPSDRVPPDSKPVKKFIKSLDPEFFIPLVPTERIDGVVYRVQTALEKAFTEEQEFYVQHIGKYGKERTSSKTFHICRVKVWEDLVKYLVKKDLATLDNIAAGSAVDFERLKQIQENIENEELKAEWCFSTRMVIQTFCSALALEFQRAIGLPRGADDPLYDQLACLVECLPMFDGMDKMINRAILEFPYPVPANLNQMEMDEILHLRSEVLPIAKKLTACIEDGAKSLETACSSKEANPVMTNVQDCHKELTQQIRKSFQSRGMKVQTCYGQYRWYPSKGSGLDSASMTAPHCTGSLTLKLVSCHVARQRKDSLYETTPCWIWAQNKPAFEQDSVLTRFMRKWFS